MAIFLTGNQRNNSPLVAVGPDSQLQQFAFTPFGHRTTTHHGSAFILGFNGERRDPVSGNYPLGKGYRAYNPTLMRFNCPDSMSPFGPGGINPYAYCLGAPINRTDPSGHISTLGWLGIGLGILGIAFTVAAIAVAGGVAAAISSASATTLVVGGLGLVADVAGIASGALEDINPSLSSTLGWASLGLGLAGGIAGVRNVIKAKKGAPGISDNGTYRSTTSTNSSLINLHPEGSKPVQFYKAISIETIKGFRGITKLHRMGIVSDFKGTGEPGILIHGSKSGFFAYTPGIFKKNGANRPQTITATPEALNPHLIDKYSIDLRTIGDRTKPLHVISCYSGGAFNAAPELADNIFRSVVSYGNNQILYSDSIDYLLGNRFAKIYNNNISIANSKLHSYHIPV